MKKRLCLLVLGVSALALAGCRTEGVSSEEASVSPSSGTPSEVTSVTPSSEEEVVTSSEEGTPETSTEEAPVATSSEAEPVVTSSEAEPVVTSSEAEPVVTSSEQEIPESSSEEETSSEAIIHTHTFSDDWTYDETNHWHAATCEHTEEKSGVEAHTLVKNADETEETCFCGYVHTLVSELAAPTNLAYDAGKLTFDAVEHAKRYTVTVTAGEEVKLSETITATEIELFTLAKGEYKVSVVAKAGELSSQVAELNINQKYFKDENRILEAEDAVTNNAHISIDEEAHGGKYALGFNDCGQGLYFQYYAFEAGERDIDVYYSTGSVGSYMKMFVGEDENNPIIVLFNENTGWFGDTKTTAKQTVKATLAQGWNDIYMFKDGTGEDFPEYGGWAQIDYIEVHGTGHILDAETNVITPIQTYRYESEQAKWHWANQYQRPNMSDAWSSHGYLGEMNAIGDGVTYNINVERAGTYLVKQAAGGAGVRYYDITVNGVKENRSIQTGAGWNVVAVDEGFLVHLNQGANTIDFSRGANGDWSCIDYLIVEFVSEEDPTLPTAVTNLAFAENTVTFTAAEGISEYIIVLTKDNEELARAYLTGTSYEVPANIHGSGITATVYAKKGFFVAETSESSLEINPGVITDKDVKLEAEKAIIGEKHYSSDSEASGGAYALGFDNCGEGLYFRYYSYEEGERKVEICYSTGAPNSKMDLKVNNSAPISVTFPENTGWFGDTKVSAIQTATVTLQKGWNDLFLYKNGTDQDNPQYGGWVQIDYIVVKGTNKQFDTTDLADLVCSSYKLEAEFSNYSINHALAPEMNSKFSIAFLGNQDAQGNGAYYKFYVDQAGKYKVQFCTGGPGEIKVDVTVNGNNIVNNDSECYTLTTGGGWDVVAADPGFEVDLIEGQNTISIARRGADGSWVCIDYCLVTLVAE